MLDASVLVAAEDPEDENHTASESLLASGLPLATLDLAAYETTNVAVRRWRNLDDAKALRERCFAIAAEGEMVRATEGLLDDANEIAAEVGISVYAAAYVAAARSLGAELASCDERDLVSRNLARLPSDFLDPA